MLPSVHGYSSLYDDRRRHSWTLPILSRKVELLFKDVEFRAYIGIILAQL